MRLILSELCPLSLVFTLGGESGGYIAAWTLYLITCRRNFNKGRRSGNHRSENCRLKRKGKRKKKRKVRTDTVWEPFQKSLAILDSCKLAQLLIASILELKRVAIEVFVSGNVCVSYQLCLHYSCSSHKTIVML